MKKLFIPLFALLTLSASAQIAPADTSHKEINLRLQTAGQSLEKGSSQAITGSVMTIVGAVIAAAGSMSDQDDSPLIYIGAATSVIGIGFTFSGFGKIGKAGKQLQ